jgi:hypothetical protein
MLGVDEHTMKECPSTICVHDSAIQVPSQLLRHTIRHRYNYGRVPLNLRIDTPFDNREGHIAIYDDATADGKIRFFVPALDSRISLYADTYGYELSCVVQRIAHMKLRDVDSGIEAELKFGNPDKPGNLRRYLTELGGYEINDTGLLSIVYYKEAKLAARQPNRPIRPLPENPLSKLR